MTAHNLKKNLEIPCFMSCFEQDLKDGFVFSGEEHDFWEFVCVTDGEVYVTADDRVFLLSKGEVIFHKPMELHKLRVGEGKNARIFVCSFTLLGKGAKGLENLTAKLSKSQEDMICRILEFVRPFDAQKNWVRSFLGPMEKKENALHTFACLTELFLLSLLESSDHIVDTSSSPDAVIFKNAVGYMEANLGESPSIEDIARHCNISASYLKKIFLRYAGLGVHKYFLKLKIKYASALLKEGLSVSEVSDTLGFSSQNYFSTVFKRETRLCPMSYKKEI